MFFKKKVGKGVRGEGKTSSPFLLLFFPFPLSQGRTRKRGSKGRRGFLGLRGQAARARASWVCWKHAGPCASWCCRRSCSRSVPPAPEIPQPLGAAGPPAPGPQPRAVTSPRWDGDPRPPGSCSCPASLHLLGVFGVTGRGGAVGLRHVVVPQPMLAVPPRCRQRHPGTLLLSPACPLRTHSWFAGHGDARGGVCVSQPASVASGLLALLPRVLLQALFCDCWSRRGSERRGQVQPRG